MYLSKTFWQLTSALFATTSLVLACVIFAMQPNADQRGNFDRIDSVAFAVRAEQLLRESNAKVAVLWSADIDVNARTVLYMHDTRGVVSQLIGYSDQI